jgi:hypothetical protein
MTCCGEPAPERFGSGRSGYGEIGAPLREGIASPGPLPSPPRSAPRCRCATVRCIGPRGTDGPANRPKASPASRSERTPWAIRRTHASPRSPHPPEALSPGPRGNLGLHRPLAQRVGFPQMTPRAVVLCRSGHPGQTPGLPQGRRPWAQTCIPDASLPMEGAAPSREAPPPSPCDAALRGVVHRLLDRVERRSAPGAPACSGSPCLRPYLRTLPDKSGTHPIAEVCPKIAGQILAVVLQNRDTSLPLGAGDS